MGGLHEYCWVNKYVENISLWIYTSISIKQIAGKVTVRSKGYAWFILIDIRMVSMSRLLNVVEVGIVSERSVCLGSSMHFQMVPMCNKMKNYCFIPPSMLFWLQNTLGFSWICFPHNCSDQFTHNYLLQ